MKAERTRTRPEFIPVIITLESQEEVDALFTIGNHTKICRALPALDHLFNILESFESDTYDAYEKLDNIIS